MKKNGEVKLYLYMMLAGAIAVPAISQMAPSQPATCERIQLTGEVNRGRQWKAAFGEGWVFRVLPIVNHGSADVSGWDLVVDRVRPVGYPDALLLATPPYNSIGEREIGTTFGLRAQDAIGWNPRHFHFLIRPAALREGQQAFRELTRETQLLGGSAPRPDAVMKRDTAKLVELEHDAPRGEFRILDARIWPGAGQPTPYAQNWALQSEKTPHSDVSMMGNPPTPLGRLDWIRFSITLWLPAGWKAPRSVAASPAPCGK
jgi:hypothetical protein